MIIRRELLMIIESGNLRFRPMGSDSIAAVLFLALLGQ
jgi:hypothetical protein